jgi:hypothetical protein
MAELANRLDMASSLLSSAFDDMERTKQVETRNKLYKAYHQIKEVRYWLEKGVV